MVVLTCSCYYYCRQILQVLTRNKHRIGYLSDVELRTKEHEEAPYQGADAPHHVPDNYPASVFRLMHNSTFASDGHADSRFKL